MFLKFREDFWVAKVPKLWLLRHQDFSQSFSPSFRRVLPAAWPRAAAPEAEHRCIGQPATAEIPWSSGSSRRTRPWMRRTVKAVASEKDSRESLMKHGILLWGSGLRCWWFKFFFLWWKVSAKQHLHQHSFFFLAFTFSAHLCLQCTDKTCQTCCIDDFSFAIFWSDHC